MKFESNQFPEATKQFRKPEKVLEWLNEDANAWDWLRTSGVQQASQAHQKMMHALNPLRQNLAGVIGGGVAQEALNWAGDALNKLSRHANKLQFLPSKSDLGVHILELRETDPELAGVMAFVALTPRTDNLPNSRIVLEATTNLRIFERGVTSSTASTTAAQVTRTKTSFDQFVEESTRQAEKVIGDIVATTKNKTSAYKRSRTLLARWVVAQRRKTRAEQRQFEDHIRSTLAQLTKESSDKIENFVDFYQNKIALQEPANYWDTKREKHRYATLALGAVFILYGSALYYLVASYLASGEVNIDTVMALVSAQPVAAVALFVVSVTLALIVSRIIYRLFLSQLHLWNDAAERVTMIKTYLALASRDHAKEEHLIALTNRLFAPASDGVVKDDFGSISVFDLITSKMK